MATKNTHLEHLEDDILNQGSKGGKNAIAFLKELGKMLTEPKSAITVTTKWDGAPAIVCGINPETEAFFVGTKSVFNKTNPKIIYVESDIEFHGYSGELAKKLKLALKYLSKNKSNSCQSLYLGCLLSLDREKDFTEKLSPVYKAINLVRKQIDGKSCIAFTPNTITYCVEKGSDIYKEVNAAEFGIVFHTKYSGSDMASMNAVLGDVSGSFTKTAKVFSGTATFKDVSGQSTFTPKEKTAFNALLSKKHQNFNWDRS